MAAVNFELQRIFYFALLLVILFVPEHSCSDLSTCSLPVDRLSVENPITFGIEAFVFRFLINLSRWILLFSLMLSEILALRLHWGLNALENLETLTRPLRMFGQRLFILDWIYFL